MTLQLSPLEIRTPSPTASSRSDDSSSDVRILIVSVAPPLKPSRACGERSVVRECERKL